MISLFYFDLLTTLTKSNEYLNTKHANVKFTSEKEVNGSLLFLDLLISRNKECFTTTVYHKPTFSGVYSNFNIFIADEYKHGLIFTLLFRIISIVSDFSKFHEDVDYLKDVLKKNYFPTNLVDKCIKMFLNKQFSQKILEHTVPKKELFIVLPYLDMSSLYLRTRLQKSINSNISFCRSKIVFKSSKRLAKFFRFEDKTPLCLRTYIVYKFMCGRCNASYYGEKCRHFKVRVGEHSGISPLTNKRPKSKKSTAIKDYTLICDQPLSFDDFKVLASSNSEFHLKIKESRLISRNQPVLNKNEQCLISYINILQSYDYLLFTIHTSLFTFCCFQ